MKPFPKTVSIICIVIALACFLGLQNGTITGTLAAGVALLCTIVCSFCMPLFAGHNGKA